MLRWRRRTCHRPRLLQSACTGTVEESAVELYSRQKHTRDLGGLREKGNLRSGRGWSNINDGGWKLPIGTGNIGVGNVGCLEGRGMLSMSFSRSSADWAERRRLW